MKSKQRLLAAIQGKPVDRMPWSPNLAYWWDYCSQEHLDMGEIEFLKFIGADPLIRGHYAYKKGLRDWEHMFLYDISYKQGCEKIVKRNGDNERLEYQTPYGSLVFEYEYSREIGSWFLRKHPIKSKEDFNLLTYIKSNTVLTPNFKRFEEESNHLGDDGLMIPLVSPDLKSGFQSLVEHWVGTEEIAYAVYDFQDVVDEALGAMKELNLRAAHICAQSSAECFLTWEDSSTTNISPTFYENYILPEINEWCDVLHRSGKLYIQHACGQLKSLMPLLAQSKIDCIESISPPPTGNIELWDARKQLPSNIALIGGIEPTQFLSLELPDLEAYVRKLMHELGDSRYVLANSDSCPPYVQLEKFMRISQLVRE